MAFIPRGKLEGRNIGNKVVLTQNVEVMAGLFEKDTVMTIIGEDRGYGYTLVDKEGNYLREVKSSKFKPYGV